PYNLRERLPIASLQPAMDNILCFSYIRFYSICQKNCYFSITVRTCVVLTAGLISPPGIITLLFHTTSEVVTGASPICSAISFHSSPSELYLNTDLEHPGCCSFCASFPTKLPSSPPYTSSLEFPSM